MRFSIDRKLSSVVDKYISVISLYHSFQNPTHNDIDRLLLKIGENILSMC